MSRCWSLSLTIYCARLFIVYASPVDSTQYLSHHPYRHHSSQHVASTSEGSTYIRVVKLYNVCTSRYVMIQPGHDKGRRERSSSRSIVNAVALADDRRANLRLVSIAVGKMTIQSNDTEEYICFNKRGRLITKKNGKRKKMCHFKENYENNFTEIRLASGPKYFLAFRRNGKPFQGHEWRTKRSWRDCKNFLHKLISEEGNIENIHPEAEGYQPVDSFSNVGGLTT